MAEIFAYRKALSSAERGLRYKTGDALSRQVHQMHVVLEATAAKPNEEDTQDHFVVSDQLREAREQNRKDLNQFREFCDSIEGKQEQARSFLSEQNRQVQEAIAFVKDAEEVARAREKEVAALEEEKAELDAHIAFLMQERAQLYSVDQHKIQFVQDLQIRSDNFQRDADFDATLDQLGRGLRKRTKAARKEAADLAKMRGKAKKDEGTYKLPDLYKRRKLEIMEQIAELEELTGLTNRTVEDDAFLDRIEAQLDGILTYLYETCDEEPDPMGSETNYWKY